MCKPPEMVSTKIQIILIVKSQQQSVQLLIVLLKLLLGGVKVNFSENRQAF